VVQLGAAEIPEAAQAHAGLTSQISLAVAGARAYIAAPMRKDMAKVIVERPRSGRSWPAKPGRTRVVVDDDGEPLRASVREPKGRPQKTKSLNETLNPLRRYLESNVGRAWNKVYSEVSENLKPTSTVQQHVRDHIEDFVAVKTRMRAGEIYATQRWGRSSKLSEMWQPLYVHPRTGLLRKNTHRKSWNAKRREDAKRREAERAARMREISATKQLHCFNGVWWEVTLAKIKLHRVKGANGREVWTQERFADVVQRAKLSTLPLEELYAKPGVYAAAKRQLGKPELKKLGLR
jgi:hypothetical protein